MRAIRISAILLLALAPALALAQNPDIIHVEHQGIEYLGYGAAFGARFPQPGTVIGPDTLVHVAGSGETAPADQGCDPLVNVDEVQGNIAMVMRGTCAFVVKVQNAVAAGAVAVVVYNHGRDHEPLVVMGGECEPDVCSIPAVLISYGSGLAILKELESPKIVTLIPIDVYQSPTGGTHDTGRVQLDVFDQGFLGRDARRDGAGFIFDGVNGLFVSTVLVGIDSSVVSNPYPFDRRSEWTAVSDIATLSGPLPVPCGGYDQGFEAEFENTDLGVRVTERSFSRTGDPYVIVELDVLNISGSDIEDAYIGLFADFDAGTASTDDAAAINSDLNLVYVFDPAEEGPYFGLLALYVPSLDGYSADATTANDAQLFTALSSQVEINSGPAERAVVMGFGPFDLAAGSGSNLVFAFIAGTDEADLFLNAEGLLFCDFPAVEATTPEGTFVLGTAYPNPFAQGTTIPFDLPTAQRVRLAVYDVLGREVAILVDGPRPAGEQAVAFDASALPSGVYLVRLDAGATRLVQRVTVVR